MAGVQKTEATSKRITELKKELEIVIRSIVKEKERYNESTFNDAERILSKLKDLLFKKSLKTFADHIPNEIMTDPVVLASGQTYDRSSIESWLDKGNLTCPKTKEALSDTKLVPNNLVKEIPTFSDDKPMSKEEEEAQFESLFVQILSPSIDRQKEAAKELRRLTKNHPSFRVLFDKSPRVILNLISPLRTMYRIDHHPDLQEDLITTLFNISLSENNKRTVLRHPETLNVLVESLKTGTVKTRGNAAAALLTLSEFEPNKGIIGKSGALKALIDLIEEGNPFILKDAAQALSSLCILSENKAKATTAGVIPVVMNKIMENTLIVDELLVLLALLSSDMTAAVLLSQLQVVPCMLRIIKDSTSERNKENCISILCNVCSNQRSMLEKLRKEANAEAVISKLTENRTDPVVLSSGQQQPKSALQSHHPTKVGCSRTGEREVEEEKITTEDHITSLENLKASKIDINAKLKGYRSELDKLNRKKNDLERSLRRLQIRIRENEVELYKKDLKATKGKGKEVKEKATIRSSIKGNQLELKKLSQIKPSAYDEWSESRLQLEYQRVSDAIKTQEVGLRNENLKLQELEAKKGELIRKYAQRLLEISSAPKEVSWREKCFPKKHFG